MSGGDKKFPDRVQEAGEKLSEHTRGAGEKLSDRAREAGEKLSDHTREAGDKLSDLSREGSARLSERSREAQDKVPDRQRVQEAVQPSAAQPNFAAGGILAAGGFYDFYTVGNMTSLVGGVGAGALMAGSGLLMERDPQSAFLLGTATGGAVAAGMLPHYMKSGQMLPMGMAMVGAAVAAYNGWHFFRWWDPQAVKK